MKGLGLGLILSAVGLVLDGCATGYIYGRPYYTMGPSVYGASYFGRYGYRKYYYGGGVYRPWRGGGWYHGGWRR